MTYGRDRGRAPANGDDRDPGRSGPAPGRGARLVDLARARRAPDATPAGAGPAAAVDVDAAFAWGDAPPTIDDVATAAIEEKGAGEAVDEGVASRVGAHLGADLGGVRVHRDPPAQAASAAMNARAFAHGGDVFLGPGESPTDLGLMAHELTHVVQQGAAGQPAPARKVAVGPTDSPAEREADAVAQAAVSGTAPTARLVDAGQIAAGQMRRDSFLVALREAVTEAADAELGPEFSAIGCPYIDLYFQRYAARPSSEVEAVLRRFAPGVRDVASAAAMIPIIVERVRAGVRTWRDTGAAPPEVVAFEPAAGTAAAASGAAGSPGPGGAPTPAPAGSGAAMVARMGPAEALPGAVASRMSGVLGQDVSGVRIHTSPAAAAVAGEQGANALAVGSHVAFAAGAYAPGTLAGDALLAHELAHTAQQGDVTDAELQRPLGDERQGDEDEADDVAAAAAIAQATGARPKRKRGGFLRGGLSLQRCNVAARPPRDFAALPLKDKAAWLEATAQSGKDARGQMILDAMRQLPPAEFVAVQGEIDFTAVVGALGDWDAVELGALGPVTGAAAARLNAKRANHVVHAMNEYSDAQAELHTAYVISTMYDDDVHDLAVELASKNRLSRLLEFELVQQNLAVRGISLDKYQDVGDGRNRAWRFASGMGKRLWGLLSQDKDDDHWLKRPQGVLGEASQALDIDATLPTTVGGALRLMDNAATFGMVGGVVGLGVNTVSGIGNLIDGDYEAAGADLTDAAVIIALHIGIKAVAGKKPAPAPPGAPGPGGPGLLGPDGPGQFTVPGFAGPLSAAEAKVGAAVTRGLSVEAQAAVGRVIGRIGRDGVERVAGYMRQRDAAALVAEHGEAGIYALDAAKGDVVAARGTLPARQLEAGASPAPAPAAPMPNGEPATAPPAGAPGGAPSQAPPAEAPTREPTNPLPEEAPAGKPTKAPGNTPDADNSATGAPQWDPRKEPKLKEHLTQRGLADDPTFHDMPPEVKKNVYNALENDPITRKSGATRKAAQDWALRRAGGNPAEFARYYEFAGSKFSQAKARARTEVTGNVRLDAERATTPEALDQAFANDSASVTSRGQAPALEGVPHDLATASVEELQALSGNVRKQPSFDFPSASSEVYHANKHAREIPEQFRDPRRNAIEQYQDAISDTVRTGDASAPRVDRSATYGDSVRIEYSKAYPDGARRAVVYVRADGQVRVVTFGAR